MEFTTDPKPSVPFGFQGSGAGVVETVQQPVDEYTEE